MEIKTFTSTLALCVFLANTAVVAGKEGENEKESNSTTVKSKLFKANDQIRVGTVTLKHTGNPEKVEEKEGKITVTTKKSAAVEYLLESARRSVSEKEEIEAPYSIVVQEGGKMSLGFLNTKRNGWYGTELILGPGSHNGVYKRTVPVGETLTSLVVRNYHLGTPGQSTFTFEDLGFKTKTIPILANEYATFEGIKLKHTGKPQKVEQTEGSVTVTTDNNAFVSYQLRSDWVSVKPGESLEVAYKVKLQPNSKMSLGFLNAKGNGWYPSLGEKAELLLTTGEEEKTYEGTYLRTVPVGEEQTSLVVRNYHLGTPGQSTFTVKDLGFKKQAPALEMLREQQTLTTSPQLDENSLTKSLIGHPKEARVLQGVSEDQEELTPQQQEALKVITENAGIKGSRPWTVGDVLTLGLGRFLW